MMSDIRHPEVTVQLTGEDGNAFFIIGRVVKAMRREGLDDAEIKQFQDEAMSGDYDNLLQTTMEWVDVR